MNAGSQRPGRAVATAIVPIVSTGGLGWARRLTTVRVTPMRKSGRSPAIRAKAALGRRARASRGRRGGWRCGCGAVSHGPGEVVSVRKVVLWEGTEHEREYWDAVVRPDDETEKHYSVGVDMVLEENAGGQG